MADEAIWISLRDLLHVLKSFDMWSIDTKYLNIYLDTRYINNDWHCTVKDREGKKYLSLEDIIELRKQINMLDN